jgi:hypothetical protein
MLFFRSEEHVKRWNEGSNLERGATMTVHQQWELARAWYTDRASPNWKRRSPEEAQELFRHLGLTGPFWELQT